MSTQHLEPNTRAANTRAISKAKRRRVILDSAQTLLASGGTTGLSLRRLAKHAGVSVPTIYNLIGDKSTVLNAALDAELAYEAVRFEIDPADPVAAPKRLVGRLMAHLSANEAFFRAEYRSLEAPLEKPERRLPRRLREAGRQLCRSADQSGLIAGSVPAEVLSEQISDALEHAYGRWATGELDLDGLGRSSLKAIYLTLAADAAEPWRGDLLAQAIAFAKQ